MEILLKEKEMELWLREKILHSNVLQDCEKLDLLDLVKTGVWDSGAIGTVHNHCKNDTGLESPVAVDAVLLNFQMRYMQNNSWNSRNASACLVALVKELS